MSAVPNVWMAHSLAGPGVRFTTAVPTAVRTSAAGEKKEASNCATPKPTAAAATPAPIRKPADGSVLMGEIYRRGPSAGDDRSMTATRTGCRPGVAGR